MLYEKGQLVELMRKGTVRALAHVEEFYNDWGEHWKSKGTEYLTVRVVESVDTVRFPFQSLKFRRQERGGYGGWERARPRHKTYSGFIRIQPTSKASEVTE